MPDTIDGLVRGTRAAARILFAAGARRVHAPAEPPLIDAAEAGRIEQRITARHFRPGTIALSAAHLMGGCAMGRSAADSVTDAWGRVHGIPWLRVADASLFPDALEINPYLTIMALADRVARSEEHTSELQSPCNLVCRLLLEKKKIGADSPNVIIVHTSLP